MWNSPYQTISVKTSDMVYAVLKNEFIFSAIFIGELIARNKHLLRGLSQRSAKSIETMSMKFIAQGHNTSIQPMIEPSISVSRHRLLNPSTDMLVIERTSRTY